MGPIPRGTPPDIPSTMTINSSQYRGELAGAGLMGSGSWPEYGRGTLSPPPGSIGGPTPPTGDAARSAPRRPYHRHDARPDGFGQVRPSDDNGGQLGIRCVLTSTDRSTPFCRYFCTWPLKRCLVSCGMLSCQLRKCLINLVFRCLRACQPQPPEPEPKIAGSSPAADIGASRTAGPPRDGRRAFQTRFKGDAEVFRERDARPRRSFEARCY